MDSKDILYTIGQYCRVFRIVNLKLTLKDVENDENIKALSSFEHGRSSNLIHLLKYVFKCESKQQQIHFLEGMLASLKGSVEHEGLEQGRHSDTTVQTEAEGTYQEV